MTDGKAQGRLSSMLLPPLLNGTEVRKASVGTQIRAKAHGKTDRITPTYAPIAVSLSPQKTFTVKTKIIFVTTTVKLRTDGNG
jgi:hypothetical protein